MQNLATLSPRSKMSEDVIPFIERAQLSRDVEISRREFAEGKGISLKQLEQDSAAFLNSLSDNEVTA